MFPLLAQITYETTSTGGDGAALVLSLIYGSIGIVALVWQIIVLVDLLKHSDTAWQVSGQSKGLWIGLWVFGLCCGPGVIIGLIYWFAIRPKLQQAASGGGYGASGGYPPA